MKNRKNIAWFVLGLVSFAAIAGVPIQTNNLKFGNGVAGNKTLTFDNSGTTVNPQIRWNQAQGYLDFSNNGITYQQIPVTSGYATASITSPTYTSASSVQQVIFANPTSNAIAITLPAVSAGLQIQVKDSGGAAATNNITVTPATGTIDGASSIKVTSNYGAVSLNSDGTNWFLTNYVSAQELWNTTRVFTFTGFGTVSTTSIWTKRVGDTLFVRGYFLFGTTTATPGSINLPAGLTIDTTKIGSQSNVGVVGTGILTTSTSNTFYATGAGTVLFYDGSTNNAVFPTYNTTSNTLTKINGSTLGSSGNYFAIDFRVPITGWGLY